MYTFELETGPEYRTQTGYFTLERGATDTKTIEMSRFVDMKKEGWWSGDLHIHRPPEEIELLMRAEDLHIGPVITWWNNQNVCGTDKPLPDQAAGAVRRQPVLSPAGRRGRARRRGAALFQSRQAAADQPHGQAREYPVAGQVSGRSPANRPVRMSTSKSRSGGTCRCGSPPGKVDSIGLANNHQQRDGMLDNEAWGKPRDTALFPSPHGNGRWSQDIYYQAAQLRPADSAVGRQCVGRAAESGRLQPRVCALRRGADLGEMVGESAAGRVVVTNGPLLRPRVFGPGAEQEGALPGPRLSGREGADRRAGDRAESGDSLATRSSTWKSCRTAKSCTKCGWMTGPRSQGQAAAGQVRPRAAGCWSGR